MLTCHPQYITQSPIWQKMRDTYEGEDHIKSKGPVYLPYTYGMILDNAGTTNTEGEARYQRYKTRAVFPEVVSGAVELMLGLLHFRAPIVEIPKELEPLLHNCTKYGESIQSFMRRVNEAQMITGRIGAMVDIRTLDGKTFPYFVSYEAETCINWDEGTDADPNLSLVVLDESFERMDYVSLSRDMVEQYRALMMDGGKYVTGQGAGWPIDDLISPSYMGKSLDFIPFVFINPRDILPAVDVPPLRSLANTALCMYRGEADYRQSLHMQGQDTLVVKGGDANTQYRIGSGASICTPTDGDAKFIGVTATGLPEQRTALQNDGAKAKELSSRLVSSGYSHAESGEALRIRVGSQTATLGSLAMASARGIEFLLKTAAKWIGANPEQVHVTPNMNFIDGTLTGAELQKLMEAKKRGAPISGETIHMLMKRNNLTNMEFEEELEKIKSEEPLEVEASATSTGAENPNDLDAR